MMTMRPPTQLAVLLGLMAACCGCAHELPEPPTRAPRTTGLGAATTGPDREAPPPPPKTILLAFDGLDHGLLVRFMEEGLLPQCSRLATLGSLNPLQTSNPAQSPVSWAVFNTGSNPGKTGVPGFVTRVFRRDQQGRANSGPLPQPMLGFPTTLRVAGPDGPREVPYEINPMQGTNWWTYLDQAGVRLLGLSIASTYPPDNEGPNTRLLSGLGVKDVSGSPGRWSVFTSDPWEVARATDTAGSIRKLAFDGDDGTRARTELVGPRNWVAERHWKDRLSAVAGQLAESGEDSELALKLEAMSSSYARWRRDPTVKALMIIDVDRDAGTAVVSIGEGAAELDQGEWSALIPVEFDLGQDQRVHALVRLLLLRCDPEDVRLFATPLQYDPGQPPLLPPLSAPPTFAATLSEGLGEPFETLGWAAMTNPLKDAEESGFTAQAFLEDIASLMAQRERLLHWALSHSNEWDIHYQVFSGTDRVAHMLFREFDEQHPAHEPAHAATPVTAWGRTFPLSQAVPEVYRQADRIVGEVLDRVAAGEFGEGCLLMVLSDHGFRSFRRQVNLNNLLLERGWLVPRSDAGDSPADRQLLRFVDWTRTRAYSMALGKIYLNLRGREPQGIVDQGDYLETLAELRADLADLTDGPGGPRVITSILTRDELFHGPWVHESSERVRKIADSNRPLAHWDGFADLFVGFSPGYRVAWNNTLGGLSDQAFSDNTNQWSGAHVSVDPSHVPGVLLSNARLPQGSGPRLQDVGPTLLRRYGLDPTRTDMDGRPLSLSLGER